MIEFATATDLDDESVEEHKGRGAELVRQAEGLAVQDDATYQAAGELYQVCRQFLREIDDTFRPIKRKMDAAKREVLTQEKKLRKPVERAESLLKLNMRGYLERVEAEERKRQELVAAEAKRRAEEEALARAAKLEEEGRAAEAEAVLDHVEPAAVPVSAPPAPQSDAVSVRRLTKWRVVDASKINRDFLVPDEKAIGALVRSRGEDAAEIVGGIEVYQEASFAAR